MVSVLTGEGQGEGPGCGGKGLPGRVARRWAGRDSEAGWVGRAQGCILNRILGEAGRAVALGQRAGRVGMANPNPITASHPAARAGWAPGLVVASPPIAGSGCRGL